MHAQTCARNHFKFARVDPFKISTGKCFQVRVGISFQVRARQCTQINAARYFQICAGMCFPIGADSFYCGFFLPRLCGQADILKFVQRAFQIREHRFFPIFARRSFQLRASGSFQFVRVDVSNSCTQKAAFKFARGNPFKFGQILKM